MLGTRAYLGSPHQRRCDRPLWPRHNGGMYAQNILSASLVPTMPEDEPAQSVWEWGYDGVVVSESAAILVYLAKKSGCLIPGDRAGEAQVVRWCFAAMNSVEPPLLSLVVLDWTADGSCGMHREFLVGWANRVLTNLEHWFADRDFVATKGFTVADILMAHVLSGIKGTGLIAPFPGIASYRDRCLARPAWKRTIEAYYARVEAG